MPGGLSRRARRSGTLARRQTASAHRVYSSTLTTAARAREDLSWCIGEASVLHRCGSSLTGGGDTTDTPSHERAKARLCGTRAVDLLVNGVESICPGVAYPIARVRSSGDALQLLHGGEAFSFSRPRPVVRFRVVLFSFPTLRFGRGAAAVRPAGNVRELRPASRP